jgi:hypothetical protein
MTESPASNADDSILVGDTVTVVPRTWPGINKPGGAARVVKVHVDGTVDLKYIMGGRESKVAPCYITSDNLLGTSRKRKTTETFEWSGSPSRKTSTRSDETRSASKQMKPEVKRDSSTEIGQPRSARKVRIAAGSNRMRSNSVETPVPQASLFAACTKTPTAKNDGQREAFCMPAPSFISPAAGLVAAQTAPALIGQTDFAAAMVKGLATAAKDMHRPSEMPSGLGLLAAVVGFASLETCT